MKMKAWLVLLIVIALLLSACGTAGNNRDGTEAAAPTRPNAADEALTPTPGAPIDLGEIAETEQPPAEEPAPALQTPPQAVEASTLATNIINTEVAGQSGRIGQVLGMVMNAESGLARYLLVRTLGLDVEKTVLLPRGAYQIALLAPDQAAESANLLPVVWLTVPDGDLAEAPEVDLGIFTSTEQLIASWDAEASQYWADQVPELPVTGEADGDASPENLLYLSVSLLENFNVPVLSAQGEEIGEIGDYVVDPGGSVTYAALRPSGLEDPPDTAVVVPVNGLEWDGTRRVYTTGISADHLRAAPPFVRSELPDMTIPGWEISWDEYWDQQQGESAQMTSVAEADEQVKISRLIGISAFDVTGNVLGEIEDMILGQNGTIRYLVVRAGNQFRPVPWIGFDFDFSEGVLTYIDDVTRFNEAPGFASMEDINPANAQWDEQIRAYWGQSR